MNKINELFKKSKFRSSKYSKYFKNYEDILGNFEGKDVTMIEIGVQDGGGLKTWQEFFGPNSKIIGVDLNPQCKKFEEENIKIYIGSQSHKNFWENLFSEEGKADIIIDDGGHTNHQQIITAINCIPNIKDGGILIYEDVHSSYLKRFGNPSRYSFINFVKKTIDDINSLFPGTERFKFSLNKYVYSIQNFESMVIFFIDRSRCKVNEKQVNDGEAFNHVDYRDLDIESKFLKKTKILRYLKKKLLFLKLRKFFK